VGEAEAGCEKPAFVSASPPQTCWTAPNSVLEMQDMADGQFRELTMGS